MNIHENTALLDAFVDGELTSEEMISVQSHLDECPECRAYVDDVLVIRASFPTEDDVELPVDFAETVMKAVAETPQSRPKKRQPWGKLAAAAACLAVIILVQHGTLGSISGSSNTSAACDTAPMEAAAAERAPEERCLTTGTTARTALPIRTQKAKKQMCIMPALCRRIRPLWRMTARQL